MNREVNMDNFSITHTHTKFRTEGCILFCITELHLHILLALVSILHAVQSNIGEKKSIR